MKILAERICGDIRRRDKSKKCSGRWAERGRINRVQHAIELILLARCWIEYLHERTIIVGSRRKIPVALVKRGHGGEIVVRSASARAVPACEEEPFVATIKE